MAPTPSLDLKKLLADTTSAISYSTALELCQAVATDAGRLTAMPSAILLLSHLQLRQLIVQGRPFSDLSEDLAKLLAGLACSALCGRFVLARALVPRMTEEDVVALDKAVEAELLRRTATPDQPGISLRNHLAQAPVSRLIPTALSALDAPLAQ